MSFECDKIIMTKNVVFVGKGYFLGELFKPNVLNVTINENIFSFAYIYSSLIIPRVIMLTLSIYSMEDLVI